MLTAMNGKAVDHGCLLFVQRVRCRSILTCPTCTMMRGEAAIM